MLRKAVGDFVAPFVLEKLFDYSCSVELAGSFLGHAAGCVILDSFI